MVLVTDKELYLDGYLKQFMDLCYQRMKKNWDNLLIVDGPERGGKTTLGITLGYYYMWLQGKTLTLDNVHFDPDDVQQYAESTKESVIIWDEAALGALSVNWQNKATKKLITTMMLTGKYKHMYIFVIPSFFKLHSYLAVFRSMALIHVLSPDKISRGYFRMFNQLQKTWLYNHHQKSMTYGKSDSGKGRFTHEKIAKAFDMDGYEKKKDRAIHKFISEEKSKEQTKLNRLQYRIATELPTVQAANLAQVDERTIYKWKKLGDSLGNEGFEPEIAPLISSTTLLEEQNEKDTRER